MSLATATPATPGIASTGARSSVRRRPCAMVLMPNAACSALAGSAMSSAYSARPLTCRCALSWRGAISTGSTVTLARIGRDFGRTHGAGRSRRLEVEPTQQIARGLQPVGAAGAQIGQRPEVLGQCRRRKLDAVLIPRPPGQSGFGRGCPGRGCRESAERDAGGADAIALLFHDECGTHRGDILIEAL